MVAGPVFDHMQLLETRVQIEAILPHRPPWLLVEKEIDFNQEQGMLAAELTVSQELCQGHFPGRPILPGVLIIEALAQTCGLFIAKRDQINLLDKKLFFGGVGNVRWKKPVVPGNRLILRAKFQKQRGSIFKFSGEAFVGETLVASVGEITILSI